MFFKQCLGLFDLKETKLFESVFLSLFIMISRHGSCVSLVSIFNYIAGLILFKKSSNSFGFIKLNLKKMKQSSKTLFQFCSKLLESGGVNLFLIIAYSSISWKPIDNLEYVGGKIVPIAIPVFANKTFNQKSLNFCLK